MRKKFKNWLIKKLGGFTWEEMLPADKFVIRKVEQADVHMLHADMTVFRETERMYRKDIEHDLIMHLAEGLEPYVRFQNRDIWARDSVTVRAEVRVLDWRNYDG